MGPAHTAPVDQFIYSDARVCFSGSTGKPKGVLHTVGGYMLYAATTFKYVFDYHPEDVYWCTADVGWITGHTYVCYGPMLNGATSVIVSQSCVRVIKGTENGAGSWPTG